MNRPTWQDYFVEIVKTVAKRGTCDRGQSGAVIVKNNQIISTGYVGSAAGDEHCDEAGHKYEYRIKGNFKKYKKELKGAYNGVVVPRKLVTQHCVKTIHAEQNAICQAAKHGHAINGTTMYTSMVPCRSCAMMIINSSISKVVALHEYQTSDHTKQLFKKCDVELVILDKSLNKY